jgi:cytoskeletal protein RodZ
MLASIGIGAALREERLRQGIELDDISRKTRIASRFLEAIEAEDFATLPGLVFTRNFVRQYSIALDLDPAPMLGSIPKPDIESAPMPDPPPKPRRMKWDPRVKSALQSVALLVVATSSITVAWMRFEHPGLFTVPIFSKHAQAPAVEVIVTALEDSWTQIVADGRTAFSGTLKMHTTQSFGASEAVLIRAGNAGALEITLNGHKLDAIGLRGQVRSVTLTAEGPQTSVQ